MSPDQNRWARRDIVSALKHVITTSGYDPNSEGVPMWGFIVDGFVTEAVRQDNLAKGNKKHRHYFTDQEVVNIANQLRPHRFSGKVAERRVSLGVNDDILDILVRKVETEPDFLSEIRTRKSKRS